MSVSSRTIGDLDNREIAGKLNAASTLCLPFGSTEQHGPHLPLNTDTVIAEAFTSRIVARWRELLRSMAIAGADCRIVA